MSISIHRIFDMSARTSIGTTLVALALLASPSAAQTHRSGSAGETMAISRRGSRAVQRGPATQFTGTVRVEPLFAATDASRASGAAVTFEPGARSAWHTHPLGQRLIVTAGTGRVQQWGGAVQELRAGDVVWTPPGVKHWHGAAPGSAMTHTAIQESLNGRNVEWLEQVTDAQYAAPVTLTTPPAGRTSGMAQDSTPKSGPYADIAPALDDFTQQVLFGQVWERPGLSKRDRSLITVATLVAMYRTNELPFHLRRALENGVTKDELTELITHLAFYAGWPSANSAVESARKVFAESPK
jgi:4-carboxymuconolactone decarboxylase